MKIKFTIIALIGLVLGTTHGQVPASPTPIAVPVPTPKTNISYPPVQVPLTNAQLLQLQAALATGGVTFGTTPSGSYLASIRVNISANGSGVATVIYAPIPVTPTPPPAGGPVRPPFAH